MTELIKPLFDQLRNTPPGGDRPSIDFSRARPETSIASDTFNGLGKARPVDLDPVAAENHQPAPTVVMVKSPAQTLYQCAVVVLLSAILVAVIWPQMDHRSELDKALERAQISLRSVLRSAN